MEVSCQPLFLDSLPWDRSLRYPLIRWLHRPRIGPVVTKTKMRLDEQESHKGKCVSVFSLKIYKKNKLFAIPIKVIPRNRVILHS